MPRSTSPATARKPTTSTTIGFPRPASTFHVGLDGLSLLLVLLTTCLVPLIVLSAFKRDFDNPSTFYALVLFMQTGLLGVFTSLDAFLFYFFWEVALIPIYLPGRGLGRGAPRGRHPQVFSLHRGGLAA